LAAFVERLQGSWPISLRSLQFCCLT